MIAITENFETIKTLSELKSILLEIIKDEQEAYGEDSGYFGKTDTELNELVDKYLTEVSIEQLEEYMELEGLYDIEEAVLNYLQEWYL